MNRRQHPLRELIAWWLEVPAAFSAVFHESSTELSENLIRPPHPTTDFGLLGWINAVVVLPLTALFVAVTGGCETGDLANWQSKSATASPIVQRVDAIEVALTEDAYETTSFIGSLKPRRSIPLAFTQGGRVAQIVVTSGQSVTAGQVLAKTDTSMLDSRKVSVETALEAARQQPSNNQNSADLRTQIGDLQRELEEINQSISNATLKAPFKGVVTQRAVEEGQVVSAGMPVFDLVESDNLIVEVKVATRIANEMAPGELVWVLIKGQPFAAVIATVLPTSQGSTRTRTVTLDFRDGQPARTFNPGDAVEVNYWTQTENSGFWLPYSVLQQQTTGLWSALIVESRDNDLYAQSRTLEVIQLHDELALVRGALNQRDRVIVNGFNRIVPGQKIRATLIENPIVVPMPKPIEPTTGDSNGAIAPGGTLP